MILPTDINIGVFQQPIKRNFSNNITKKACNMLGGMLALDYNIRVKVTVTDHIATCVTKLKNYLGQKVITDDSFSTIVVLFSVAISPEQRKDNKNSMNQEQDTTIDSIINLHFGDLTAQEKDLVRGLLKDMLLSKDRSAIVNFIAAESKLFKKLVLEALIMSSKQLEINNHVRKNMQKILHKVVDLNKKITNFKEIASKLTMTACTLGVIGAGLLTGGIILPIIAVPGLLLSMKYAPKMGERVAQMILDSDKAITTEIHNITQLKNDILKDNKAKISQQEVLKEQTKQVSTIDLSQFKEQLSEVSVTNQRAGNYARATITKANEQNKSSGGRGVK